MERDLSRYENGKIYSIRSHQTDKYYIGSTCLDLYKRLFNHRSNYKNHLNNKYHYTSSYEILKYDDHYIELIEDFSCKSKRELEKREGELQRQYKNDIVNHYYAHTSPEQTLEKQNKYRESNKEQILEKHKQYYQMNKEKVVEKQKQYREANKEQIAEQVKKYYEANKEKVKEYHKQYREKKKAEIN